MDNVALALTAIFVIGVGAQWLAWRLKLPSILVLMISGFIAGPVTGWFSPDRLMGELLLPVVSLSVGLILFEGGLSLKWSELRSVGRVLLPLLTIGVVSTWVLAAGGAYLLLEMTPPIALLLGAILTVTGPTVIGPLLREIRPKGKVGLIAKWEGIVVDPIGAILAVLVYEAIEVVHRGKILDAALLSVKSPLLSLLIGGLIGVVAAWLLAECLRRYAIPDHLQSPAVFTAVLAAFTGANLLQPESGLVTVTVMGVLLANQSTVSVRHIVEFKENLRVLLIASLFILLAARLQLEQFRELGWRNAAFVAWLILVVRPVSVWISTWRIGLTTAERLFLGWFAPRGIVAAAVSSVFALRLGDSAGGLVETIFLVVVSTVTVYGLSGEWLARRLGLADSQAQGLLIVGAHALARDIAAAVQSAGIPVLLVDSNRENIHAAKMSHLPAHHASALSEGILNELDLGGLGRMLALTVNDEVNTLATQQFADVFGRGEVYQLTPKNESREKTRTAAHLRRGRFLFGAEITFDELQRRHRDGAHARKTPLTSAFSTADFRTEHGPDALPLFLVTEQRQLRVFTVDSPPTPKAGDSLISLVPRGSPASSPSGDSPASG